MYVSMRTAGEFESTESRKPGYWDRRSVNLPVDIVFPSQGIRKIHAARCSVSGISGYGASIKIGDLKTIPDLFYMELDEGRISVSCHVVNSKDGVMNVRFGQRIPEHLLDKVIENFESRLKNKTH